MCYVEQIKEDGGGGAGCIRKRGSLCKILVTTPEEKSRLVVLGVDGKIQLTKVKKKSKVVSFHAIKAYLGEGVWRHLFGTE
jgi:hypothetical protein